MTTGFLKSESNKAQLKPSVHPKLYNTGGQGMSDL